MEGVETSIKDVRGKGKNRWEKEEDEVSDKCGEVHFGRGGEMGGGGMSELPDHLLLKLLSFEILSDLTLQRFDGSRWR